MGKNGGSVVNNSYYTADFGILLLGQQMVVGLAVSQCVYLEDIIIK